MVELKRLVDKEALLAEWDRQSSRGHYEFDQTIMEFPVTTEKEIRNKAIDEFAEKLGEAFAKCTSEIAVNDMIFDILTLDGAIEIMWELAEQLKEE